MKNRTGIIACICLLLINITFLATNIHQEKIIIKQNRIIALQTEQIFNYQNTIELQDELIKDHEDMNNIFYDILNLHDLLQEVE